MNKEPRTPLEALKALVAKLEQIESSSEFKAVWPLVSVHGFKYTGPDWSEELKQAKMLLSDWEDTKS